MDLLDAYHFDLHEELDPPHDLLNIIHHESAPEDLSLLQPGSKKLSVMKSCKKKLAQLKKVVCVPITGADASKLDMSKGLTPPTDLWAWRKYGQKPIKGSPYPRGYYRCSSSKGCSARKQVERSRRDPSMLIITYTADHNHAPTNAGSNRSSAAVAATLSPSSSKDHDEATLLITDHTTNHEQDEEDDDDDDPFNLPTSSSQSHLSQPHSPPHNIKCLPTFPNPNTAPFHNPNPTPFHNPHTTYPQYNSNTTTLIISSPRYSSDYGALEAQDQQAPSYWGPTREEEELHCIAGDQWQKAEDAGYNLSYYIHEEKKDQNVSITTCTASTVARCEEDDDFFSELGMLPELASIFNKRDINNVEERTGPDEIRSLSLDHEHAIFGIPPWSSTPTCPLA